MMYQLIRYTLAILVFIVFLSLWVFYNAIRPILHVTSSVTPVQYGLPYENVSFYTSDHVLIKGWFILNKNPHAKTIILLHGYPADKGDILPSRIFLHKDYNLLFIDFRFLGESGGHYSTAGKMEVEDLRAAIKYLHTRNINEVGVWGWSLGGAVALLASPDSPEIKAVVAESPYARLGLVADKYYPIFGLDIVIGKLLRLWSWVFLNIDLDSLQPAESIKQIKIPVLLIYNKDDQIIGYKHAVVMREATKNKKNVTLIINENLPHNALMENYQEVIKTFFADKL